MWHLLLKNKKIVRLIKNCSELPGYELFKYIDGEGNLHILTSQDVNFFLQSLTNKHFTAKDFRTWTASREFFYHLIKLSKKNISDEQFKIVLIDVAKKLGNTISVCKKSYIHPAILSNWNSGDLQKWVIRNHQKISQYGKDELFLYWLQTS